MVLKQATVCMCTLTILLLTSLVTAQSLELVYTSRPGNNRIALECRRGGFAVSNPEIWVERSNLRRQTVPILGNVNGRVTIEITQDLEGSYSCSYSGDGSSNTLDLVAYPQPESIQSPYTFQAGLPGTIHCQVMPGKLSRYYSVRWTKSSVTIATSTPHDVLPQYELHDNFSLTIKDAQPSDSSASYQCSVTIDDPQILGSNADRVYDQLHSITVMVYVSTPATTSTVVSNPVPTTPEDTTSPPAEGPQLSIILPTSLGGLLLVVVFILLILIVIKLRKKTHPATAEGLRKKAEKLGEIVDKKVQKLSNNPHKRKLQEERIAHINQEIQNLQAQANTIRQENYQKARELNKEAAGFEEEASKMEEKLSTIPSQNMKESKKIIRKKRKEAENRYKQARHYDRIARDSDETKDGDKEGSGGLETDLGEDATCRSKTNPNSTIPQQETSV